MSVKPVTKAITLPAGKHKSLTVLGSTGSIGISTLKIIRQHPDRYSIRALTAQENVEILISQALEFKPQMVVIGNAEKAAVLKDALAGTGIRCASGTTGLLEAATLESDMVMAAIVGAAGLPPALAAVRRGATIALANKECLVCAGGLFLREVQRCNARLLPVDSEHNAIYQIFDFAHPERVENIVVTASGGPFRGFSQKQLECVTPEEAVKHPNWSMGAKISVDSATMINKGLEIIEAYYLFPVRKDQIEVVVHPESIIHSMVTFVDGSVLAQMGAPDMCIPISYALAYPERITNTSARLNLTQLKTLSFYEPDIAVFPALSLARAALEAEGTSPAILNAANEIAVDAFLKKQIRFTDIVTIIEQTLSALATSTPITLEDVVAADNEARSIATRFVQQRS